MSPHAVFSFDDAGFAQGYRAAPATIHDCHAYADAIEQLKALGQDDQPERGQSDRYYG